MNFLLWNGPQTYEYQISDYCRIHVSYHTDLQVECCGSVRFCRITAQRGTCASCILATILPMSPAILKAAVESCPIRKLAVKHDQHQTILKPTADKLGSTRDPQHGMFQKKFNRRSYPSTRRGAYDHLSVSSEYIHKCVMYER